MRPYEFPTELEKALGTTRASEIERWLRSFKDLQREMDLKLLYLARYFESIPESLKPKYLETLVSVLESVPHNVKISTTVALSDRLNALTQTLNDDGFKHKLRTALEKNLEAR